MPTNTMIALDKVTVGTATNTITFSSIPQGYTDLVLEYAGSTASAANMFVRVGNGSLDTGSNYSLTQMVGSGSSASSTRLSSQAEIKITEGIFVNTNEQCNISIDFQGYSNTTTNKTLLSRANSAAIGVQAQVSLWRLTSAINTISVYASQNFNTGTTFSLYGIAAASVGAKATGGTIYSDADYFYHVFASSGTFTPTQSITADCLVVAGGGSGGLQYAGGGGAGGLVFTSSASLGNGTAYTCTVGAGAPKAVDSSPRNGSNGNNSTFAGSGFSTITATGGGLGGGDFGNVPRNGGNGGSGGGGSATSNGMGSGGTGSQGFNGAAGVNSSGFFGGGGGGAGEAGNTDGLSFGGDGTSAYSSWGLATGTGENVGGVYFYAGGGSGSQNNSVGCAGGSGGGGLGGGTGGAAPTSGLPNTGGGGGAGWGGLNNGGAGGSGIVIIRYAK